MTILLRLSAAWIGLSLLVVAILLAGCETVNSEPPRLVKPRLDSYSLEFQRQLADEMTGRVACDRVEPMPPCSAWVRAVIDYGDLRRRVRSAEQ